MTGYMLIVAEASDGKVTWANQLRMRAEDWAMLGELGFQEERVRQVADGLARKIPAGLDIHTHLFHDYDEED